MRGYLREKREQRGLTQQDMASRLDISLSYYNQIENGDRQKNLELLLADKIAHFLGVSIDFIITEETKLLQQSA